MILLHNFPTVRANIASFLSTYTHVSSLYWYEDHYGLVYRIDILFRTIQGVTVRYSPTLFDRFVWIFSVFTQYSYYRDLFCLGPSSRLCDRHSHMQVRYIDITNITVWCMSLILIRMNCFYFYTICISEHYNLIVGYSPTPFLQVGVILWNITITVGFHS